MEVPNTKFISRTTHRKRLYAVNKTLLRVSGLVDDTKAFATAWKILSGQSYHLNLQLRLYKLDAVQPVSGSERSNSDNPIADLCNQVGISVKCIV